MSFDGTQPQPTQNISSGQATILNNFAFLANTAGNSTTGYYKFPNGLIMQWGSILNVTSGNQSQNFPTTFPNNCFNVQLTASNDSSGTKWISLNQMGVGGAFTKILFNYRVSTAGQDLYWFAIGN